MSTPDFKWLVLGVWNGSWQTASQWAMRATRATQGVGEKKETQVKTANLHMKSWALIILIEAGVVNW